MVRAAVILAGLVLFAAGGTPQNDLVLNYGQTYHILGWTIVPSSDGTRFTNDGTGHGMFVSIENVKSF